MDLSNFESVTVHCLFQDNQDENAKLSLARLNQYAV